LGASSIRPSRRGPAGNATVTAPNPVFGKGGRLASALQRINYSETFWAYLFLAPTLIGLLVFSLGPILASLGLSLMKWNIIDTPKWVGLLNFQVLFKESLFWKALVNTLRYMVMAIPLEMLLSLVFAVLLSRGLRGESFFRTAFFAPGVCSVVAMAMVWRQIFDFKLGMLNGLLSYFGVNPIPWLLITQTAMPAVVLMSVWMGVGFSMLLWLAALQGVPQTYYDAALVDGAGRWAKFRYVTWPLITPTAFFMLIIDVIASFQVFQQTFVLTGGGPQQSTYTLVLYIYDKAFRNFLLGDASATAYVLFFIMLGLTVVQFRLQKRWVNYELA
jgi:multiple sugar transport system permease protein